ncbi:MAG: nuclear transport factor 2 family protein [Nannocystaceae bacterium]|nr:nuclear transport factor 2 family protein [Nannocystaceae bacterium]
MVLARPRGPWQVAAVDHADVIATLYRSLDAGDGEAMAALYHPDATFSDPVFTDLKGKEVGAMWQMLCSRSSDLRVEHSAVKVDGDRGSAHWEAYYTFSATGRSVHNIIDAEFRFEGDKIIEHRDHFSLWRWSRQALGPIGLALGWSPIVAGKVRGQASKGLALYMKAT